MHSFHVNDQLFILHVRYQLIKSIGTGAYGTVIAAKDLHHEKEVAIKKITNLFDDLIDAKRILREIRLLRHFQHPNITRLFDVSCSSSKSVETNKKITTKSFDEIYIMTELMETDLHQVIYSMQPMSDEHIQYFMYQILCGLYHLHSAGVLHRDMKPSNILLNANCDLKICDFGLARGGILENHENNNSMELTEYVVTRWYRAPEIMLNCLCYTKAVDIWSIGCIFAEMIAREPLFPGKDYIHQLKLILNFLGTPKQEDIEFIQNKKALKFVTKLPIVKSQNVFHYFSNCQNPLAIDLLQKMLMFNPKKRISVWEALHHPYLATFFDEKDLIPSTKKMDFSFDLPDEKLTKEKLMHLLYQDIAFFHPSQRSTSPTLPLSPLPSMRRTPFGMTAQAS